jgi:nucleotide-binding universal stress UspA family protein
VTVLVGFVPTAEGEAAFAAGLAEASRRGEDLLVRGSPRDGAPVSADVAPPEVVADLSARAEAAGVPLRLVQEARRGELADDVLRAADDADASVIVVGLRRRSPVGKLILGSSAQRILLEADRPVPAVKPAQH